MFERDVENGDWHRIETEEQFQSLRKEAHAVVEKGEWYGPGNYLALSYSQRCPRGCCYDDVYELLTASSALYELERRESKIKSLTELARLKSCEDKDNN